jgi:hypothetical protein
MRGRQLRRAVLVALTAALGCLLVAQFSQLTRGVRVSQAALVARVDGPPPDANAPRFPDPHQHWPGGGSGGWDGSGYGGGSGGWDGSGYGGGGSGGWDGSGYGGGSGGGYGGWDGSGYGGGSGGGYGGWDGSGYGGGYGGGSGGWDGSGYGGWSGSGSGGGHRHWYRHWPGPRPWSPDPVPSVSPPPAPRPAVSHAPSPAPTVAAAPGPAGFPAPAPARTASRAAPSPVASFPIPVPAGISHPRRQSWPVTLTIRTLPALPHVQFSFDGRPVVTDGSGEASYTEPHNFDHHSLTLVDTSIDTRGRHYHFARWAGERDAADAFRAGVNGLPMRADYTVTAAFTVECPVRPRFTDQHGRALDPRRISRVTLKSSAGRQVNISATHPSWLDCAQPAYRDSTLTSNDMRYAAQAVMFAKANIVYAGVERFSPREQATPTFVGYFHNLTITAHDALFGGRIGSYALVRMPNHVVRRVTLGPGHAVTLDHLPQGDYQIDVRAGGAIVSAGSFRLSRTKTVNLTAVSAPDLATVGGGLLLAGGGLPLLTTTRRRRLLKHLRLRRPGRPKWWPR